MRKFGVTGADPLGARPFGHRHDVDGLRAVAVLAILAFHLDLAGFSGGFLGVDIFFVISGYVILRSILPNLESGQFSLADFFIRRMRRILPALMVVLLATLAAGFIILAPSELAELAGSALATLGFGANFFFHDRTGYFTSAAHARPLLHMWSLGIEEQFYIVVPLALAALARYRGITAGKPLIALAAASFAYSLIAPIAVTETHAFYMPMARFWEIAVGGCLAVAERRWGPVSRGADWLAAFGILVIAASVLLLNSDAGGQQWAAVPVLGTAALIVAGGARRCRTAVVLASTPMVAIGRISYSIYLVHSPLIVLWRLYTGHALLPHEQVVIAVLTVALAAVLGAFVERPMRAGSRRIGNRVAIGGIVTASTVVAVAGAALTLDHGAGWRLTPPARAALATLQAEPPCHTDKQWLASAAGVCRLSSRASGTDFVIWGDSHAGALGPKLAQIFDAAGRSGVWAFRGNCPPIAGVKVQGPKFPKACPTFANSVLDAIVLQKPRVVVMVGRWANYASDVPAPGDGQKRSHLVDMENGGTPIELADALIRTIKRIQEAGAQVVLVGPVPEIDYDVPATLVRSLQGLGHLPPVLFIDFERRQRRVLNALAKIEARNEAIVVYAHTTLCDNTICVVADGNQPLYRDDDHLSPLGAARIGALVASTIGQFQSQAKSSTSAKAL